MDAEVIVACSVRSENDHVGTKSRIVVDLLEDRQSVVEGTTTYRKTVSKPAILVTY
jgi:hypothetical protein